MYKSPIDMLVTDIQHQIAQQQDEEAYKAVVSVGIHVDKEELLRALKYDRDQYNRGHLDGYHDAMAELVRCQDCKHCRNFVYEHSKESCLRCALWSEDYPMVKTDDFCSYGERIGND